MNRVDYDPIAKSGHGFPFQITLQSVDAIPGTAATVDQYYFPADMATDSDGFCFKATQLQLLIQGATNASTGTPDQFLVRHVDASGNTLATLLSRNFVASSAAAGETNLGSGQVPYRETVNLRDASNVPVRIKPGEGLLFYGDAGSSAGASKSLIRIFGQAYGLEA